MIRNRHLVFVAAALVVVLGIPDSHAEGTLVAHWEFEDANDLGHDSSGMGNHITDITSVEQVEGIYGQAAFFDEGQGSVFRLDGGLNGFTGIPGRTFAAWVKLDPATNGFDGLISQDGGGCCNTRLLLHPDNKPFINLTEHRDRHITASPPVVVDEWAHYTLVGTNEGGTSVGRVYLNGVEVGVENFPNEMASGARWNTYLGVGESGTAHRLTGALDDVRVYEGALTPEEVLQIMDPPTTKFQLTITHNPDGNTLDISWDSAGGMVYNLRSIVDPSSDAPIDWPIFGDNQDIIAEPPTNTITIPLPPEAQRYFVVEEFPAPPESIFSDDFESGQGDWTTGSDGADGTAWELGAPSGAGPVAANSGDNCWATNLAADYGLDADVYLRSPPIDLTNAGGATLNFAHYFDIEEGFDEGIIAILDAADDSELATAGSPIDGVSVEWELKSVSIPAEALGKTVRIEFRFKSDDISNFAGWYIDDVNVTVP